VRQRCAAVSGLTALRVGSNRPAVEGRSPLEAVDDSSGPGQPGAQLCWLTAGCYWYRTVVAPVAALQVMVPWAKALARPPVTVYSLLVG